MAFRFVHTADWQIGATHAGLGAAAVQAREARFTAAERVVAAADARGVDAVVLAGDVFEDVNVARADVQRVVDLLRASRAPVFVLSGNHDPLVPKGPYDHPAWAAAAPHVTVFRDAAPVPCGPADFLPCPVRTRRSFADPLEALPAFDPAAPRRLRVGVAHGSLRGGPLDDDRIGDDFPIDRAHVSRAGLDYLALGHWHRPSAWEVDGVPRVFYCGAHEPTAVDEISDDGSRSSGQCLLVELDAPGAPPRTEAVRTAVLDWRREAATFSGPDDVAKFRARLDGEPAASRASAVRLFACSGALPPSAAGALRDLEELAAARFLHARVRLDGVKFLPDGDAWTDALPAGAPREAARTLAATAAGDGPEAATARRALRLLWRLSEEARA
ncbi:MAG TPA: DNA repair exonuclease [Planctomycetota bacterium]|nr:DNA repair exonuclease [Planctomycetota bacterium]